jgi:hypothetical protein
LKHACAFRLYQEKPLKYNGLFREVIQYYLHRIIYNLAQVPDNQSYLYLSEAMPAQIPLSLELV